MLGWFSAYFLICFWSLQVPALEHDGKVIGESMDLLNYLDEHFEGPKLAPVVSNLRCTSTYFLSFSCAGLTISSSEIVVF